MPLEKRLTRRDFVKLCGAAGLILAAPATLVPLTEAEAGPGRFTQTRLKMGTIVTLTAIGDSAAQAEEAFEAAWAEMDRLTSVFDRHRTGTAISELNNNGRLSDPGPEMLEVLTRTADIYRLSKGAFDPTILPLLTLIESSFNQTGRPPAEDELTRALGLVNFGQVRFGRSGVNLGAAGRQISLDGVAKGYIVDRAGHVLKQAGIQNALINAGGDILALGHRKNGQPWRIAIQDPFKSDKHLRVINLSDQAVATSGSYEIFYDRRKKYHHLVSPFAGRPAVELVSATVVSSTTDRADAMSTAAFIRPEIYTSAPGIEGMVVTSGGRLSMTSGFKELLVRS